MGRVDDYFRTILANGWNTWESRKRLTKDEKGVMIDTDDEERWITIGAVPPSKKRDRRTGETVNVPGRKGKHVKIDENGNIVAGLGGKFGNLNDIGTKGNGGKSGAGSSGSGNSSKQPPEPPKPKEPPVVLSVDELPELFRKGKGKNTQTVLYNYANNKKGASESCKRLIGMMKNVLKFCPVHKISYTQNNHYISTPISKSVKEIYGVCIPALNKNSSQEEIDAGVATIFHEFTHVLDYSSDGWFSTKNKELSDEIDNISNSGVMYGKEIADHFAEYNKFYDGLKIESKKKRDEEIEGLRKKYIPDGNIWTNLNGYNQFIKESNALQKKYDQERFLKCEAYAGGGSACLQGIYDSLSGGKLRASGAVKYGHSVSYFQKKPENRQIEMIADYVSLNIVNPEMADMLRRDQPKLCEALDKVVKEMGDKLQS